CLRSKDRSLAADKNDRAHGITRQCRHYFPGASKESDSIEPPRAKHFATSDQARRAAESRRTHGDYRVRFDEDSRAFGGETRTGQSGAIGALGEKARLLT